MTPLAITKIFQTGDHRLRLSFNDGKEQEVDFLPFLSSSHHPAIRRFLEPGCFATYRLEYGDLLWGDYELCFPIADLYDNRLIHGDIPLAA